MKNNQKHLCILDDDKSIRWVLEKAFQKENFKVSSFEDAESILKNFEKIKPDIILSDVRMPGISGIDLVERLKREYPHIPIIIMTAFSDLETTVASLQKGAYEYLTKPFDIDNVILVRTSHSSSKPIRAGKRKGEVGLKDLRTRPIHISGRIRYM